MGAICQYVTTKWDERGVGVAVVMVVMFFFVFRFPERGQQKRGGEKKSPRKMRTLRVWPIRHICGRIPFAPTPQNCSTQLAYSHGSKCHRAVWLELHYRGRCDFFCCRIGSGFLLERCYFLAHTEMIWRWKMVIQPISIITDQWFHIVEGYPLIFLSCSSCSWRFLKHVGCDKIFGSWRALLRDFANVQPDFWAGFLSLDALLIRSMQIFTQTLPGGWDFPHWYRTPSFRCFLLPNGGIILKKPAGLWDFVTGITIFFLDDNMPLSFTPNSGGPSYGIPSSQNANVTKWQELSL